MVDVLCKQVMKGHAMSKVSKRKSPLEIADLILMHNAGASMEMIGNVISEWGDSPDDHPYGDDQSVDFETAAPDGQP
jgi:hypothetical protein